jgi:hypothetical protein
VWTEYNGPLWVDVALAIQAEHGGEEWKLEGIEEAATRPLVGARLESEESDTTSEMFHTVLAKAFPHLYELVDEAEAEEPLDRDRVRSAALMDLWLHRGGGKLPAWLREMFKTREGSGGSEA